MDRQRHLPLCAIIILLFAAGNAGAAVWPAATASLADVNAAIAKCSPGDTVTVPAGTASWAGGVSISGITLQGTGQAAAGGTIITAGTVTMTKHASAYTKMIGFRFTANDQHFEIGGALTNKAYVVGDCYFSNNGAVFGHLTTNGGLFYLCNFVAVTPHAADCFAINLGGLGTAGGTSWAAPSSMGTDDTTGETNNYFENCSWTGFLEISLDNDNGARTVVRNCTFTDSSLTCHGGGSGSSGNDTSSYGNKHLEVYDCTFVRVSNANAINKWVWVRGGGFIFVNNVVPEAGSPDGSSYPNKVELSLTVGCPGPYPIAYQFGQTVQSPENPPTRPSLIYGNTGAGTSSSNYITIGENPNNSCGTPGNFIQAGRDYKTSNTWGWTRYPYPHPLRSSAPAAGTYYVNKTTGLDSNPGTQASPWKNCPGMSGSSNYTGSGVLNPGDTVYLDRASTWNVSSGSNGGFYLVGGVTYIGNSYGSGSNLAKIRAEAACAAGVVRFRDHATIETQFLGFEVDGNSQVTNGIDINTAFWQLMNGATKRVQDCIVHHTFSQQSAGQYCYGVIVSNHGGTGGYAENVEIINTVVHDVSRDAICLYPGDENANCRIKNILVRGCTAYNTGQDPGYTAGSGILVKGYVVDSVIENNTVHDTQGANYFFNSMETNHYGVGIQNCVMRNNIAYGTGQGGILVFNGASGSDPMDVKAYGNIIRGTYSTAGLWIDASVGNTVTFQFYNNTFLAPVNINNPSASGTIKFQNNLISVSGAAPPLTDSGNDLSTHTNNTFFRSGGGTLVTSGANNYTAANLASYEPTALSSDPLFVNSASPPTGFTGTYPALVPNTTGLSISAGSPSAGTAVDLGASFNTSIGGVTRTAPWDRGAYELVAGPLSLGSATISPAGNQIVLNFSQAVQAGSGGNGGWTIAASGGPVTVTFGGMTGAGSNALTYPLSRSIQFGETVTVSYVQPTNGIEDLSGNDLASLTNQSVTNSSTQGQTVATPVITLAAGTYSSAQTTTITDTTPGAVIRYTSDGSTPTSASPAYSSAISIPSTMTIKAIGTKAGGYIDSAVASSLFTINIVNPTGTRVLGLRGVPASGGAAP